MEGLFNCTLYNRILSFGAGLAGFGWARGRREIWMIYMSVTCLRGNILFYFAFLFYDWVFD